MQWFLRCFISKHSSAWYLGITVAFTNFYRIGTFLRFNVWLKYIVHV